MSDKEQLSSVPVYQCRCIRCYRHFFSDNNDATSCCSGIIAHEVTHAVPQRDERQTTVFNWVKEAFGVKIAMNVRERMTRFLEEAVELAQSEGLEWDEVNKIVAHVMSRPPGDPEQEVGGVSVTLLAYCAISGKSADGLEMREIMRILSKDPKEFADRQNKKAFLGIGMPVDKTP